MTQSDNRKSSVETHRIKVSEGSLHVRVCPGSGPAFVLLHGFPDNSRIYEDLMPHLAEAGRHVISFDFLGFGSSDKPADAVYSFAQQRRDLEAVVSALQLETIIPVGHDAGGPAAVNFALDYPDRTAGVVVMNAFYDETPGLRVPELIELFSHKPLKALQAHFLRSPQQFAWLLEFQRELMRADITEKQSARYEELLGPLIDENFRQTPSAAPAFAQMTFQLREEMCANSARVGLLRRARMPFTFIWGKNDPYLHVSAAEIMRSQMRVGKLHLLDAGHWPQIDEAAEVARIMLANH